MDQADISWLAGLFEGEGSIVLPSAHPTTVGLSIFMTDEDIIRRVSDITECGSVSGPYTYKGKKPIYRWMTSSHRDSARILCAMYPLLGERRKAKAAEAVERYKLATRGMSSKCAKGHEFTRLNKNGKRYCLECRSEGQRRRRAAIRAAKERND